MIDLAGGWRLRQWGKRNKVGESGELLDIVNSRLKVSHLRGTYG
jgi:hypothetical protein